MSHRPSRLSQNLGWIVACVAVGALGFVLGQGPATAEAQSSRSQQQQPGMPSAHTQMLTAAAPITREGSTRAIALFDQFGNMQLLQPANTANWMDPSGRGSWSIK